MRSCVNSLITAEPLRSRDSSCLTELHRARLQKSWVYCWRGQSAHQAQNNTCCAVCRVIPQWSCFYNEGTPKSQAKPLMSRVSLLKIYLCVALTCDQWINPGTLIKCVREGVFTTYIREGDSIKYYSFYFLWPQWKEWNVRRKVRRLN